MSLPRLRGGQLGVGTFQSEKLLHCRDGAGGILFLRHMAEIVKDYHSAAGNIVVESIRGIGRNQAVSASPDNEGRQFQLRNAVGETGWTPSPTLDDRPAIPLRTG